VWCCQRDPASLLFDRPAEALDRRREASDRVGEFGDSARDIIDGETSWDITLIADDVAAPLVRAMVATAETVVAEPSAPTIGRMVIEIGKHRRIIVDAGVDAAALVLTILEQR
jgi:hypothetical protein